MRGHISNLSKAVRMGGWRGGVEFFSRLAHRKFFPEGKGTRIWARDWDVIILLDACRYDLMKDVFPDYVFLNSIEPYRSVGSHSKEWLKRTFSREFRTETESTSYISANPHTNQIVSENQFSHLEEVWRYGWDPDSNTIPPRAVTDTAISIARERDWNRLIVHYMQPHVPFLDHSGRDSGYIEANYQEVVKNASDWNKSRNKFKHREISDAMFWNRYRSNLELVLDDVELLLQNIDAEKVVITSDHGNAVGERGLYGHPSGVDIPALRLVPWCTATATDTDGYIPRQPDEGTDISIEDQLEALGYQ